MCTERSNAEIAGSSGRTTNPGGEGGVTDESGGGGSRVNGALRAALARVISAIRAFSAGKAAPPFLAGDTDLPEWSGKPRVTLMAVDPYLAHVYWDFDLDTLPPDTTAEVLRFYDATAHFDVDVDLRTRNWYVPLWSPAKTYYADLGAITAAGEFVPLLRSNTIQTSRAWPVAEVEHHYVACAATSPDSAAPSISQEPVPPQTPPLRSGHVGNLEITLRADGPPTASEPPAAELTVSAAAPATKPHFPKPPGAAEVLRRRLHEIAEFRQGQPQAQEAAVESAHAIPPPRPAAPDLPNDLTARAERQFSPGLSSLLLGAQGPTRQPG